MSSHWQYQDGLLDWNEIFEMSKEPRLKSPRSNVRASTPSSPYFVSSPSPNAKKKKNDFVSLFRDYLTILNGKSMQAQEQQTDIKRMKEVSQPTIKKIVQRMMVRETLYLLCLIPEKDLWLEVANELKNILTKSQYTEELLLIEKINQLIGRIEELPTHTKKISQLIQSEKIRDHLEKTIEERKWWEAKLKKKPKKKKVHVQSRQYSTPLLQQQQQEEQQLQRFYSFQQKPKRKPKKSMAQKLGVCWLCRKYCPIINQQQA